MRSSTGSLSKLSDFLANLWGAPAIITMIIAGAIIALAVLYQNRRSFRAALVELLREAEAIKSHEQKLLSRPEPVSSMRQRLDSTMPDRGQHRPVR